MKTDSKAVREIKNTFYEGNFSEEAEIEKLVDSGMDVESATHLVKSVVAELTKGKTTPQRTQQENEVLKIMLGVICCVSFIGPLFGIHSFIWYGVALVIAGIAGYMAYRTKPLAGILSAMSMVLLAPYTAGFYFSTRRPVFNMEAAIPVLIAAVPAWGLFLLLSQLLYSKRD